MSSKGLDEALKVLRDEGWGAALDVIRSLGLDLELFIVYYDLVRRGRKVRPGVRPRTLLYEDGAGRTYEVLVLNEGNSVSVESLVEWSRRAAADSHEPIIAVVDESGGVTYYQSRAARSLV